MGFLIIIPPHMFNIVQCWHYSFSVRRDKNRLLHRGCRFCFDRENSLDWRVGGVLR